MRALRHISLFLVIAFLVAISIGISFGDEEKPDFFLRDYKSGVKKSLKDILITKANLLIVTETSCYSCIKELKSMEWLRAKYKGDISVTVSFVDREGWSRVKKYLDFYNFDLDLFLIDSSSTIPQRFQVTYIPTMIIFDAAGNEVYRKQGFAEGEESLISAKIDEILYAKPVRMAREPSAEETEVKKTSGCASTG